MAAFTLPSLTVFNQGQVSANAKVYVYETGTTTPVTTYSDADLTTPNTNPIIADSNGQVVFFIGATTALRLDLYTSGDSFIKTLDPVYPAANYTSGGSAAEASIVAASTTDLGSTGSNIILISGSTTITAFGSSASTASPIYNCRLTGAPLLTHNATSLILPGSANIQGANGDSFVAEYLGSGNWKVLSYSPITGKPIISTASVTYNAIAGCLITSLTGTNTTASATITSGQAADSTNAAYITSAGYSWAASNGNAINGTDAASSTLADTTTYHIFLCSGTSGTGTFCSSSLTPTFPTGYTTYSRRIGSFKTDGTGAPLPFTGNEIGGGATMNYLTTQLLDINGATPGNSSRTLYTLSVPGGVKMEPLIRYAGNRAGGSYFLVTSPDESDVAVAAATSGNYYSYFTAAPGFDDGGSNTVGVAAGNKRLLTNTSGQIGVRQTASDTAAFYLVTLGWVDFRRS